MYWRVAWYSPQSLSPAMCSLTRQGTVPNARGDFTAALGSSRSREEGSDSHGLGLYFSAHAARSREKRAALFFYTQ